MAVATGSAGTWRDHFEGTGLVPEWSGMRNDFQLRNRLLEGQSASPVAVSPLNFLEIAVDSRECEVGSWVNVVAPNSRVCTKGALILRHAGPNAYVFALHQATQTIELYRMATHEMLFKKAAKIELGQWYHLRAILRGPDISLLVDGELVAAISDSLYPEGSVGLAVQDAEICWFDDFFVKGAAVTGNVDTIDLPQLRLLSETDRAVRFSFFAEAGYDYHVQAASGVFTHDWLTLTNFRAKLQSFEAELSDPHTNAARFYRVEKTSCNCD